MDCPPLARSRGDIIQSNGTKERRGGGSRNKHALAALIAAAILAPPFSANAAATNDQVLGILAGILKTFSTMLAQEQQYTAPPAIPLGGGSANTIAAASNIGQLVGVQISNPAIQGTLSVGNIPDLSNLYLPVEGGIADFTTATTTFNAEGGINLQGGCFAVNGVCIGSNSGGGGGGGPAASSTLLADDNTFSGTTTFSGNTALRGATSTSFAIASVANSLLSTNANGSVIGTAVSGPLSFSANTLSIAQANGSQNGFLASSDWTLFNNKVASSSLLAAIAAAYPFPQSGNGTSTLTQFNGGITAYASSTIGNGGGSGLTINGSATTTGTAYVGGSVGVGTTSPGSLLALANVANFTPATSTFYSAGGINVESGCFAVNGVCIGGSDDGGGGGGPAASSTLLSDNNTFAGINSFTNASSNFAGTWQGFAPSHFQTAGTYLAGLGNYATTTAGAISLSTTTASFNGLTLGQTIAVGAAGITFAPTISGTLNNGGLANSSITINSTPIALGASATIAAASSTLLSDDNTFSGTDTFTNPLQASITGNAGTVTNGVYTTTFGTLFDNRLSATTSLPGIATLSNLAAVGTIGSGTWSGLFGAVSGANLTHLTAANIDAGTAGIGITGNAGTATKLQTARTINNVSFDGSSDIVITAASSSLLGDNNTFAGFNSFTGNTSFASATSSTFAITTLANQLLSANGNGSLIPTAVSLPLLFSSNALSIQQANGSQNGFLSLSDWTNFNDKVASSSLFASIAAAYPFPQSGNGTSTLTQFNGGITAYASSTIGDGTFGITVNGGATTTGTAYFSGKVGIGTNALGSFDFAAGSASAAVQDAYADQARIASLSSTVYSPGAISLQPALCGQYSVVGLDGLSYATVLGADGKCWFATNLGTTHVPTSATDSAGYGDLYQWGRLRDGHQLTTSATTNTLATNPTNPGTSSFILSPSSPNDWVTPQDNNLWGDANRTNNVCPVGWHVPSQTEWAAWASAAGVSSCSSNCLNVLYGTSLKLPSAGDRNGSNGSLGNQGSFGGYWSSTVNGANAYFLSFGATGVLPANLNGRAGGLSVRCIQGS